MSTFPKHLDPNELNWLKRPGLLRIMEIIQAGGGEARVVGGAVRDALLGRDVLEVDLAVNLSPEKVTELLIREGLKVAPTGLAHGTVTVVADHVGYEMTTLRRDVATDGRHAKVVFTDDWQADAARRDFTMNALYVDATGALYDYFDGYQDLARGRVRFIGAARDRISEDVLRILRFFRFLAWFGKGEPDSDALAACQELANLLPKLSVERVWRELMKLLAAPCPKMAWELMQNTGVVAVILPEVPHMELLVSLLEVEKKYHYSPSPLRRLAALLEGKGGLNSAEVPLLSEKATTFAKRLKISKKEMNTLIALITLPNQLKESLDPIPFRRALYAYGKDDCLDALLLLMAKGQKFDFVNLHELAMNWQRPEFPLQGEDIVNLGLPPGPAVGDLLRCVLEWWINQDFAATRQECLQQAKAHISRK